MKDVILIDKPAGWTSFDVVAKIRGGLRRRQQIANGNQQMDSGPLSPLNSKNSNLRTKVKVGHAGTLDPFATGLLIILLGEACKQAEDFLKLDKTYEFTARLGEVSTTGDPEGEITQVSEEIPESKKLERVLAQFVGTIIQTPPAFSAIKVDGKRAYKLAREGKVVEIPARQIQVYSLELVSYQYPNLKCICKVSSGTYIRSLVEDIGEALQTGAYCQELRRTQIGNYDLKAAQTVENYLLKSAN